MKSIYEKYKSGSSYIAVPNYTIELNFNLRLIVTYAIGNYLFYDRTEQFTYLIGKAFEGLILSHAATAYPYRFESFDLFTLRAALLHIHTENLENILGNTQKIEISDKELKRLVSLIHTFLSQVHKKTLFGESERNEEMKSLLQNYYFKETFRRIFSNIFVISQRISWEREDWQATLTETLTKFIETEDDLYWFDLKKLSRFIETRTHLFSYDQIARLLEIAVSRHKANINKYQDLIESLCKCLKRDFPDRRIASIRFYQQALASSFTKDDNLKFEILYQIYPVISQNHQQSIIAEAETILSQTFDAHFYQELLWRNILDWKSQNYFHQLITSINASHQRSTISIKGNSLDIDDVTFYNFCMLIHYLKIPLDDPRFKAISGLNLIEQWLLNPLDFDYSQFDPIWIIAVEKSRIINLIKGKTEVHLAIEDTLRKNYDAKLASIYYTKLLL